MSFCFYNSKVFENLVILGAVFFFISYSGQYFIKLGVIVDNLRIVIILLSLWIFLLLLNLSFKYKKFSLKLYSGVIWGLMLLLVFSIRRANLLGFYIFFEFSLIPLFMLVIGWGYQSERIQAAFYLLVYTVIGSLPLIVILLILYVWSTIFWSVAEMLARFDVRFSIRMICFIFFGFFIKLPCYGVHLWLPKAHVEAPVAGRIVLAAILLKLRAYGVYRLLFYFNASLNLTFIIVLLVWGGVCRRNVALRQTDLKSLVAYSSIGHIAVIMAGCIYLQSLRVFGCIIILIAHGFCSSALFFIVNRIYELNKSRQIFLFRGIIMLAFNSAICWFCFIAINFSAPPFFRIFGELFILGVGFRVSTTYFFFIIIIRFIRAVFRIMLFRRVIHGKTLFTFSGASCQDIFFLSFFYHVVPSLFLRVKVSLLIF